MVCCISRERERGREEGRGGGGGVGMVADAAHLMCKFYKPNVQISVSNFKFNSNREIGHRSYSRARLTYVVVDNAVISENL